MSILGTKEGRHKERKKKPDEVLSSVVRETAVPAAVELLRSNQRFTFPSGTAWVMLVLEAGAIGGLSKRHGRDEAKGSIIQLIESDQIHTVATQGMLEEEFFGIIPSEASLSRMEEYSLLVNAEYSWAVVWQKPTGDLIVDIVSSATFQQARDVLLGQLPLQDAVGEQAWAEHSGFESESDRASGDQSLRDEIFDTPVQVQDDEDDEGPAGDEPAAAPELHDVPVTDEEEVPEGFDDAIALEPAQPLADPVDEAELADDPEPEYDEDEGEAEWGTDLSDEAGFDEAGFDEDALAEAVFSESQEAALELLARRFMSDELELDIRLEEFNATFGQGSPVVQMVVPDDVTEWLGDQIAQLSRQANAELAHLHYANEETLRTTYVALMSKHAHEVMTSVSTDREGSKYKALRDKAISIRDERRRDFEKTVHERRKEITDAYEVNAKRIGEQAALEAENRFKERNRPKMEREHLEVAAEVTRTIEDDAAQAEVEINKVRRAQAQMQMQHGQSRIFEIITEQHKQQVAAEKELIESWRAQIQDVIDTNRKADQSRAEVLAKQLARSNEVDELTTSHSVKLTAMQSEHAERLRRLEGEFERDLQSAIEKQRLSDSNWQRQVELEKANTASETRRADGLADQLQKLADTYRTQYAAMTEKIEADNKAVNANMAAAEAMQNRTSKLTTVMWVVLAVFMGIVGGLVGAAWF